MAEYDISKITAPNGDICNLKDKSKLPKDFSGLSEKITPATGDILPIESNGTTYKIDYNALAAAILNRLGAGTDGIVDITHGGTGAKTAAVYTEDQYSSLLDAINAVRSNRTFPISIQKAGYSSYSDLPSGIGDTKEFCAVLLGDKTRLSCLLFVYDNGGSVFYRRFYNGSWSDGWKTLMGNNNILGIANGGTEATTAAGACANLGAARFITLARDTDINTVRAPGLYWCDGVKNTPIYPTDQRWGYMVILGSPYETSCMQLYAHNTSTILYARRYSNSNWESWYKFTGTIVT